MRLFEGFSNRNVRAKVHLSRRQNLRGFIVTAFQLKSFLDSSTHTQIPHHFYYYHHYLAHWLMTQTCCKLTSGHQQTNHLPPFAIASLPKNSFQNDEYDHFEIFYLEQNKNLNDSTFKITLTVKNWLCIFRVPNNRTYVRKEVIPLTSLCIELMF